MYKHVWAKPAVLAVVVVLAACSGGSPTALLKDVQDIPEVQDVSDGGSATDRGHGEVDLVQPSEVVLVDAEVQAADLETEVDAVPACENGDDCSPGLGCVDGVCASCQDSTQCPSEQACIDGVCGKCQFTSECADDLACIVGKCQECTIDHATECEGSVCVEGHCVPCEDDSDCQQQYGAADKPYHCEEGLCTPDSCVTGSDCHLILKVCQAGYCMGCETAADCTDGQNGQYPPGTPCIAGLCYPEDVQCEGATDCIENFPDMPICGSNHFCRECHKNSECAEALESGAAICLTAGECIAGDCGGVEGVGCTAGQLCKDNLCSICESDSECKTAWFAYSICEDGTCVDGCKPEDTPFCEVSDEDCIPGQLCKDNRWQDCGSPEQCAEAYSQAEYICEPDIEFQGHMTCQKGCAVSTACDLAGEAGVCDDTHHCAQCPDDAACKTAWYDNSICQQGVCVDGCKPLDTPFCEEGDCLPGQLCKNNYWVDCGSPEQCVEAYGQQHYVCDPAPEDAQHLTCQEGCVTAAACDLAGKPAVCDATHHCIPCGNDTECKMAYFAISICEQGVCIDGCKPEDTPFCEVQNGDCLAGQLCKDNRWTDCSSPEQCVEAYGQQHYVCDPSPEDPQHKTCQPGCFVGQGCTLEEGLKAWCDVTHHCASCLDADDTDQVCKPWGADYICDSTDSDDPDSPVACVEGCKPETVCNPAEDDDCIKGQFCGDDNRWRDCDADSDECADAKDTNWICDPDPDNPGHSTCQAGCITGTACTFAGTMGVCDATHHCMPCAADLDCKTAYLSHWVCEQGACMEGCKTGEAPLSCPTQVCGPDNRCKPCGEDQECKNAYNLSQYICKPADAQHATNFCAMGCTPGFQACPEGKICDEFFHCKGCSDVSQDWLCKNEYGPKHICVGGKCVDGECREGVDCLAAGEPLCIDHFCAGCKDQPGFSCPSDSVCLGGDCVPGNCCTVPDCKPWLACGAGQACNSHYCAGCDAGEDCYDDPKFHCLIKTGACTIDHQCEAVTELLEEGMIKEDYCFINGECVEDGAPGPKCTICYSDTTQGGSVTDWTPGLWDIWTKTWKAEKCLINGACYDLHEGNPTTEQFRDCVWCDPVQGNRDSLLNWSPRPAPSPALQDRVRCADPMYFPGTIDQDGEPVFLDSYPYSGTGECIDDPETLEKSRCGWCWQGRCHGISWLPWLPLGPAAAGGVYQNIQFDGKDAAFVGSFGGGFGGGLPNANPGCHSPECGW